MTFSFFESEKSNKSSKEEQKQRDFLGALTQNFDPLSTFEPPPQHPVDLDTSSYWNVMFNIKINKQPYPKKTYVNNLLEGISKYCHSIHGEVLLETLPGTSFRTLLKLCRKPPSGVHRRVLQVFMLEDFHGLLN